MEKLWLQHYPAKVPESIDADSFASVVDVLNLAVDRFAEKPAFCNHDTTLSYADWNRLAYQFSAYLQNTLGIGKGNCVAIMMPNLLQYPVALLGIMRTGAMIANVNPLYTARELKHQLNDAGAKTIVISAPATPVLGEVLEDTAVENVVIAQMDDLLTVDLTVAPIDDRIPNYTSFGDALEKGQSQTLNSPKIGGDDVLFLQYTGGTTGISKGATLTHRNVVANMLQTSAWLSPKLVEGEETVITALPIYHIFALTVNCLVFANLGGCNVLITNPRDMPSFVKELGNWHFTAITGVNTLYNGLLHTPGFADLDFSSLKVSIGGGAAVQRLVAELWSKTTGCTLLEGYGLSETSPVLCMNPITATEYSAGIGLPVPSTEISLRDDSDNEVALGEAGELCARGPQVMRGYWRQPEATAEVMTEDGFLRTGDIATVDENGHFQIVDRKKDMILVSGFNVYPNEIEDVMVRCEGVLECASIGVPDEKTGEAVAIFIVTNPGVELNIDKVRSFCKQHLARYKIPKLINFVNALPKSPVGKILRRKLREL